MKFYLFTLVSGILSFAAELSFAQQTGDIDTNFRISQNGVLNGTIYQVLVQPDQKVLALGNFAGIGNYSSPYLLRFHVDGKVDTSFRSPFWVGQLRFNFSAYFANTNKVSLMKDGDFLVSGDFDSVGINPIRGITILDSTGIPDSSFHAYRSLVNSSYPVVNHLSAIKGDSDFFYTSFQTIDNGSVFARLLPHGEWDTSFHLIIRQSGSFENNLIWNISALRGHKLLLHLLQASFNDPGGNDYHLYSGFIINYSGQTLFDYSIPISGSTYISYKWFREDSSGTLFSDLCEIGGISTYQHGFARVSPGETPYFTSDWYEINCGELMNDRELMVGMGSLVFKATRIDSTPVKLQIGSADNDVLSIARNAANQAYLSGGFTQYNGQPYPKLVRIHNFKTITSTAPKQETAFGLYPNPSSSGQCILTASQTFSQISVTDLLGRQIPFQFDALPDHQYQLKLASSPTLAGIYLIRIKDVDSVAALKWVVNPQ